MKVLSETDINKLIVACNKTIMASTCRMTQREYQHIINRLASYKQHHYNHETPNS